MGGVGYPPLIMPINVPMVIPIGYLCPKAVTRGRTHWAWEPQSRRALVPLRAAPEAKRLGVSSTSVSAKKDRTVLAGCGCCLPHHF